MKLLYKKVLRELAITSYFNSNVYLDDGVLLDNLESETILDTLEREEISKENRNKDKLELLFSTLIVKDDEKYVAFKKSLAKDYDHVAGWMNELEIKFENACSRCSSDIKELLRKSVVEREGESLDLVDIQHCILTHVRNSKEYQDTLDGVLDESFMLECIKAEFPMSTESSISAAPSIQANRKKKKKSKTLPLIQPQKIVITSITWSNLENELPVDNGDETDDSDDLDASLSDVEKTLKVKLNETDFSRLVEVILDKNVPDWDRNILKKIKQQKIDSEIFDNLNDLDKRELIPIIGERVRLEVEWKKVKEGKSDLLKEVIPQETQRRSEHMRRFDYPASERTKYTEGYFAPSPSSRPGNLLQPVRKYVMPETQDSKKATENIVDEIISFAAGCLNERTNGTFHCGILENGKIQGCDIDKNSIDALLTRSIRERFKALQIETALKCIRPIRCIDVIALSQPCGRKYVMEVDVIPSSVITGTQMFYVKEMKKGSYLLYRYRDTSIQSLGCDEIDEFIKESEAIFKQRKDMESKKKGPKKEDLNKRLKDFLCCGESEFEESLYPILLLSTIENDDKEQFSQNELLCKVPWRAVLDFNMKDDEKGFQVVLEQGHKTTFLTHFVDDFNPRKREEMMIKKTKDNLTDSPLPAWVYCNGTGDKPPTNDLREWTPEYIESFRKVTEFYSFTFPDKRVRIIIPIFKKERVIFEAIVELLLNFGKQCLILSPSRSIASMCEDELRRRTNVFPPDVSIDDFFLIGLSWNQVSDCIKNIIKTERVTNGFVIPTTHGVPFEIDHKIVNELSDIDIVGLKTCHEFEYLTEEEKLAKEKECREKYYGGGSVEWINFYFKEDHVLRREVQTDLDDHVKNALEDYNDNLVVQKVVMYHQPGSGGSTTSKQVLWDLREKYKCCVIKKITSETCDQIGRLRVMGEERDDGYEIKPVLVLIDDNDEDAITKLAEDLEKESEKYECDVFCVLLICFRVSSLPLDRDRDLRYVFLNQKLSKRENNWFKEKYESLLKHHEQKSGCDPKTLLAFNIMKENFSEVAIKQSVKAFVCDDSIEPKQLKMLKYLSFFNAFDLHFQSIPISCFDPIMAPRIQWVRDISPSIRVLTSRCHRQGYGGKIQAIRMSNYLLSRPVLDTIIEIEGGLRNTIGEVALDIMGSKCFRETFIKQEDRILRKILGDISKKRDREKPSGKLEKFSPLIMELLRQEDKDQAIGIVTETYSITNDPLVAQQLSRLHAALCNWKKAHDAIDEAIGQKQLNSYLIHTKGQLFKEQMQASFSQYNKDGVEFPVSQVDGVVELTENSIKCFRRCQELSESQDSSLPNPAGYESEILVCVELVRLIRRCPPLQIYHSIQTPGRNEEISQQSYSFLKRLPEIAAVTFDKVERIIHATNRHFFHGHSRSLYTINKAQLDKHKNELSRYFTGESCKTVASKVQCPRGVWSLLSAYRYSKPEELLHYIRMQNDAIIPKSHMRTYLGVILSVALSYPTELSRKGERLMDISRKYYDTPGNVTNNVVKLESYLYFTVFHWPLLSRMILKDTISPFSTWSKAVTGWLEFEKGNAKKVVNRNDKILFYLANSQEYPNLVKADPSPMAYETLARFQGVVNQDGTEINLCIDSFQSNQSANVKIPFYKKITRNTVYNKTIGVVVGIGLQGPRADWLEKPSSFRTRLFRSSDRRMNAPVDTYTSFNLPGQTNSNPTRQISASADIRGPRRHFQQAEKYSTGNGVGLRPRAAVSGMIPPSYVGFQQNTQYCQRYEATPPAPTLSLRSNPGVPDTSVPPPRSRENPWNRVPQYSTSYFYNNSNVQQGATGWQTMGVGRQIDPQRYSGAEVSGRGQRPSSNQETRNVGNSNTKHGNKLVKRNQPPH